MLQNDYHSKDMFHTSCFLYMDCFCNVRKHLYA